MNLIRLAIDKPVAVTVAVLLAILFGILALVNIPVQMTPNIDATVITVSTFWEGASPQEVEQEIVEKQEEKLKNVSNLRKMTSSSSESMAQIALEFYIGVDKNIAKQEVSDKLREVSSYPDNVDEPVIVAANPNDRDYIAWIMFESTDPDLDVRTLQIFAEDHVKPRLKRVKGIAEINVLGGREREVQVCFDPIRLAQLHITYSQLVEALRAENTNVSAGSVEEGKVDVRIRTVGRFASLDDIEKTIITYGEGGPIRIGDVAHAQMSYKKPDAFVRSEGKTVIAINAQREVGTNVMEVMEGLRAEIARLNEPGGLLEAHARRLDLNGTLTLRQKYDQTIYIEQAIDLVVTNIFIGGGLAVFMLLLFLRSIRSVGIIALAIPISVVGTFIALVAMGRNLNVISLAGMAFSVGMVVDNAIVVLENIFRHLEMGESPGQAAYRGTREVFGAVLASTLTTMIVFVPILFIAEEAGQLFRDIALAICSAVFLSLIVSVTVIPCAANRWLRGFAKHDRATGTKKKREPRISAAVARLVYWLTGSVMARLALVLVFVVVSVYGSYRLMPPTDYLPQGNRNIVFGMIFPPPGYNVDKMFEIAQRVESDIQPFWEAGNHIHDPSVYEQLVADLPTVPYNNWFTGQLEEITPPSVSNYFFVGFSGLMFQGAISDDPKRVPDIAKLLTYASRSEKMPGAFGFARQTPLFSLGGMSGSSINIEIVGDDLDEVTAAASSAYREFTSEYGHSKVQSSPSNFNLPGPELQIKIDRVRAADLGLNTRDVGLAIRTLGNGAIIGEYHAGGDAIDLKLIDQNSINEDGTPKRRDLFNLRDTPVATLTGEVVPLHSFAQLIRTTAPQQINRVEERRAVTLEYTPPAGLPLEKAMSDIRDKLESMRERGLIPPTIDTNLAGSADKLTAVQKSLLGDVSLAGLLSSRMFLALLIVYLLMCILFESFMYPVAIMLTVPLATLGGFAALRGVWLWTSMDPYQPVQNLDILTMLGFVILIGVVVNNAILIVHQALNFMRGSAEWEGQHSEPLPPRRAIARSVQTRVRPILMSTLTSAGGMLPLVLMPGSGSELYRGLGSVVIGGLLVSTIFTLILVPLLFSLIVDLRSVFIRGQNSSV